MIHKARILAAVSLAIVVATLAIVTIMYQFGLGLVGFWLSAVVVSVAGWFILGIVDAPEAEKGERGS